MDISCLWVLLAVLLCSSFASAESGQYRSRVLLSPAGQIDKGAALSIEELEQQIGSIDQPYAKSSAGRHLARYYVDQGNYDKAIDYFKTALGAQGLADIANREMLRELARVYLLKEDYSAAVNTLERVVSLDLVPSAADYLMLARAQHRLGKYVAVVVALDQISENKLEMNAPQMHQALALYYGAGAYLQCELLLDQLLTLEPEEARNWHLLVSVYLQQDKKREALDRLVLAREKAVPFSERDILLLADLQSVNKNPYAAAETLSKALAAKEVEGSAENYRKLFEFWFQARELARAQQALQHAVQISPDTQLYLYLAQLQMEQQAWKRMNNTMREACSEQLKDRYVSRANLLLGISQLKLGDNVAARRSFINASLIGGAVEQAGQWLNFMNAEPASREEARRIVGVCFGEGDKQSKVVPTVGRQTHNRLVVPAVKSQKPVQSIEIKTVPAMRLFYVEESKGLALLGQTIQSKGLRLNISLSRAGGSAEGPLHIIGNINNGERQAVQLALPSKGLPNANGRYKTRRAKTFKCAYKTYSQSLENLPMLLSQFREVLQNQGFELTGEFRALINASSGAAGSAFELQVGLE